MSTDDESGTTEIPSYCGHCGLPAHTPDAHGVDSDRDDSNGGCSTRLTMEPPRYCSQCRRRMKVQVDPFGWSAACSRHGTVTQ